MEIDLFTVAAQLVNFVVLVALLKRFLYGPLTRAVDERERRIATRLEEAATARREAEEEAERMRQRRAELDADRDRLLEEARDEADQRRSRLLADAREDVQRQRERWREAVERERETLIEELQQRLVERVHRIARRALRALADEELERAVSRAFLRRLDELDAGTWARGPHGVGDEAPSVLVTSAFPLDEPVRAAIATRVRASAGEDVALRYELDPETIAGIELRSHGVRVAWSLGDFVDSLEDLIPAAGPVPAVEGAR